MAERDGGRAAAALLFAVYLLLLTWLVMWKLHVPYVGRDDMRAVKLIPFVAGDGFGASAPWEVLGNAAVFVPFGVYLGMLAPGWRWARVGATVGLVSLTFEVAQYVLAAGRSDVTDVIVNTTGGLVGFALFVAARRLRPVVAVSLTRILAVGTAIVLLAVGVRIASFPQLPPPSQVSSITQSAGGPSR